MIWIVIIVAGLAALWLALVLFLIQRFPEPYWDWNHIDLDDLYVPDNFLWGVATASHQVEGFSDNNNWSRWETQTDADGNPRVAGGQTAGRACDHWNRYEADIELIKQLGLGAYRLSLAWGKIEPEQGRFDDAAIEHYHQVIGAVKRAGLTPMVTLHHFTHPLWFEDMGSFENVENIDHWLRFCERMFGEYGSEVELWCTLNEPAVFTTQGWFSGIFPPGKRDPQLTAEVLANLVVAHTRAYALLKNLPGGDRAQIGLVKSVFQFEPSRRWHLLDWWMARINHHIFSGAILDSLNTGRFVARVPGMISVARDIPAAPDSFDFIGLNYYSHFHVRFQANPKEPFTLIKRPGDIQTDMPYPIYAEGFHSALTDLSRLGKPIYVTENGIADAKDAYRELFIRRYLYAMSRAISEGVDVRGYFYWTLMDNFEWAEGYDMRFGLYEMNIETLERRLRDGSRAFVDIVAQHGDAP